MKARLTMVALALASCSPAYAHDIPQVESVYWHDPDSGCFNKPEHEKQCTKDTYKFRLANWDGPETGSMKMRGGAKCPTEIEWGKRAAEYMRGFTGPYIITADYGHDKYDRHVVSLYALQGDMGELGSRAGMLKAWRFKNGKALQKKPLWCGE